MKRSTAVLLATFLILLPAQQSIAAFSLWKNCAEYWRKISSAFVRPAPYDLFSDIDPLFKIRKNRGEPLAYHVPLIHVFKQKEVLPEKGVILVIGPGENQWEWLFPLLVRPDCTVQIATGQETPATLHLLTDGKRGEAGMLYKSDYDTYFDRLPNPLEPNPLFKLWTNAKQLVASKKIPLQSVHLEDFNKFRKLIEDRVQMFHLLNKNTYRPIPPVPTRHIAYTQDLTRELWDFDLHPYSEPTPIPPANLVIAVNPIHYSWRDIRQHTRPNTTVLSSSFDGRYPIPWNQPELPMIQIHDRYVERVTPGLVRQRIENSDPPRGVILFRAPP